MKQFVLAYFFIGIVFLSNSSAEETIRVAVGEWPPYYSENLKHYGPALHIVTEAFALGGIKVHYEFFPWGRALYLVKKGDWDATCCWAKTIERDTFIIFSEPVHPDETVFFHLKEYKFKWKSVEDLKGIEIGATISYSYSEELEAAEKAGKLIIERVPTDELNFRKLLKGRIQIFPLAKDVGYAMLNKVFKPEDVQKFTHHPKPTRVGYLRIAFSKKLKQSKKLKTIFNNGLNILKKNGKYDKYFKESQEGKYILK
ncbi:MAG: ABC transporter substrate-binding protein [Deltaproteobacteria bacterium]|nr:ABC transporter substrate-binding protein [Deltaproteobacteria bacterium]